MNKKFLVKFFIFWPFDNYLGIKEKIKKRGVCKMAILDVIINEVAEHEKYSDDDFLAELATGYLEIEITQKRERLRDYTEAYQVIDDKDSFNAQYLKVLIDVLKDEVKEKKKLLFSY